MKTLQLIGIATTILVILIIVATPHAYYLGMPEYVDYTVIAFSILNLSLTWLYKARRRLLQIIVLTTMTSFIYVVSSSYNYKDGDWDLKDYRLKYIHIELSDLWINRLQDFSFYCFSIFILAELALFVYSVIWAVQWLKPKAIKRKYTTTS